MFFEKIKNHLQDFAFLGIIISLAAVGVSGTVSFAHGVVPDAMLLLVVFLVTFSSYSINRLSDMHNEDVINHPQRTKYLSKIVNLELVVIFFMAIAIILTFIFGNLLALLTVLAFPITVIFYSYKFFSKRAHRFLRQFRLKQVLIVKNFLVSCTWGLLAFLTVFWSGLAISHATIFSFVFIFIRILIGCIVFDLRDVVGDAKHKIDTIPIVFGRTFTLNLLLFLNTLSGVLLLVAAYLKIVPLYFVSLVLIVFYSYHYIFQAFQKNVDLRMLCDVLVDGEYFLWLVVIAFTYFLLGG